MRTDGAWMDLEPLIETCRPKGKTPPQDLRRTISALVWRHQNGAKWRAIPAELGPGSRAAQTFIRWAHLGVWERRLRLAQERGVQLGMTFLDGTSIRAHQTRRSLQPDHSIARGDGGAIRPLHRRIDRRIEQTEGKQGCIHARDDTGL